jgi:hypothetical protein
MTTGHARRVFVPLTDSGWSRPHPQGDDAMHGTMQSMHTERGDRYLRGPYQRLVKHSRVVSSPRQSVRHDT